MVAYGPGHGGQRPSVRPSDGRRAVVWFAPEHFQCALVPHGAYNLTSAGCALAARR